jgi:hypothetical protein
MRAHLVRVDAVIVQAVIAGALSFSHLHDLAAAARQGGWKAWAYPVSVDLLLVAAWRRMRQAQRAGQAAGGPRLWFLVALAASLGANIATAGLLDTDQVPAWLRILVAGWPAIAFLGGTLLAHTTPTPTPAAPAAVAVEHEDQGPAPEPVAQPAVEPTPQPVIEAAPEPATVQVPAALVDHARKVAAEHRTRTGTPIDTPTLRARLGVPVPMAEALAARL